MIRIVLILSLFSPAFSFAQITGKVLNKETGEPITGALLLLDGKKESTSDKQGLFNLNRFTFPCWLSVQKETFQVDSILLNEAPVGPVLFELKPKIKEIDNVVISAGKRKQKIEEVSVSMEILRPGLINNKGITDLEQAVNQSPGVYAMDGQVSIRGGGGYAYGAGSRVLLSWNGIPMVSPDVGDVKWNAIPMENTNQIEVIKGASSVLYGSGALNGIISMSEKDPLRKGEFFVKMQSGIYDNPRRKSLQWWDKYKNPTLHNIDVFGGKMYKRFGYTVSASGFKTGGYRKGEVEDRYRLGGSFVYRPEKLTNLKLGVFYNAQYQYTGNFILWESDSLGYIAQNGMDPMGPGSTLSYQKSVRVNVDPYIKFTDKYKNKHELKTRYYLVSTGNLDQVYASSKAEMYYGNYQFQKQWNQSVLSTGVSIMNNNVLSPVFGNHFSENYAIYAQFERKWKAVDLTLGARGEYFEMDNQQVDSYYNIGAFWKKSWEIPVYPILRAGLHIAATKTTHIRASFGQGIRFPSVAERYAATSNGGVIIFPNPSLRPEIGQASEIAVKQLVKLGDWKGFIDVAAFINSYDNMIEYTFGVYAPDSIQVTTANLTQWVGFQAQNAENARITGVEFSFNSTGKIKDVELISIMGYTYMNPKSLNEDPNYILLCSDTTSRMLKYRFKHLIKADIEANYASLSFGASCRYNSFMSNIDRVFLEDLNPTSDELYVLPGLKEYREKFNNGSLVFDARVAYTLKEKLRMGFIVNNILNAEYVSRPADIQAPRTFMLQLQYKI
jgi:iron complex outermembrane receptor protein